MAQDNEQISAQAKAFEVAGCQVDPTGLQITVGGVGVRIEAKVMAVLLYLCEHAGRVVSRTELEKQLWPGRVVTEDSVTKAIAKLRRVFHDDARNPHLIETIPKSGYRLIGSVRLTDRAETTDACVTQDTPTRREQRPKWIGVTAVTVLVAAIMWLALVSLTQQSSPPDTAPIRPAVAVIPFENLGRMPEFDYFANGITADLITDLSKLKGLFVIAPRTAFVYRDDRQETARISTELGVDYVVTGTVQRIEQALRINVNLIESRSGQALWGERYTGGLDQVFAIQDRIAVEVAAALRLELAPDERRQLTQHATSSVAAYDAYLLGFEAHGRRSEAQNQLARKHFEESIALDPGFARAYAGLALTYSREAIDGWTSDPTHSLKLAAEYAGKAAALDYSLPQVHFVTGQVRLFQRLHADAVAAAEQAINVDPNYADAFALLAWTLNYAGRPERAMTALNMAMRLNPRAPASYLEILGEIYFVEGRYRDSASTFQKVLDINPAYLRARLWNSAALVRSGATELADWELDEALNASPQLTLKRLASAFPFKDPRTKQLLFQALSSAGLPD